MGMESSGWLRNISLSVSPRSEYRRRPEREAARYLSERRACSLNESYTRETFSNARAMSMANPGRCVYIITATSSAKRSISAICCLREPLFTSSESDSKASP